MKPKTVYVVQHEEDVSVIQKQWVETFPPYTTKKCAVAQAKRITTNLLTPRVIRRTERQVWP